MLRSPSCLEGGGNHTWRLPLRWPREPRRPTPPPTPSANPPADDPLVGSIAQQYLTDRELHDKTAAEWTKRYAQG